MRTSREVLVEHRVRAPRDLVFRYFTEPDRHAEWQGLRCELDPRPGGIYRVWYSPDVWIVGRYLHVDPPSRLVLSWGWQTENPDAIVRTASHLLETADASVRARAAAERDEAGLAEELLEVGPESTTVEIDLFADGDETLVRIRHTGLPTGRCSHLHAIGWDIVLPHLGEAAALSAATSP